MVSLLHPWMPGPISIPQNDTPIIMPPLNHMRIPLKRSPSRKSRVICPWVAWVCLLISPHLTLYLIPLASIFYPTINEYLANIILPCRNSRPWWSSIEMRWCFCWFFYSSSCFLFVILISFVFVLFFYTILFFWLFVLIFLFVPLSFCYFALSGIIIYNGYRPLQSWVGNKELTIKGHWLSGFCPPNCDWSSFIVASSASNVFSWECR